MRAHRRLKAPVAVLAAVALVALGPAAAVAEEDPLGDAVTSIQEGTGGSLEDQGSGGSGSVPDGSGGSGGEAPDVTTQTTPSSPPPAPTSDDDSAGHETTDPAPPDHGQGTVAETHVGEEHVATVGDNKATVEDDDSTMADSTILALGGEQILGTSADSEGEQETHFGDPLGPVCEGSEGGVCLRILYADAWATDDGKTSSSRSQSGVADVCIGGDDASPEADCSGPVAAGAANSKGEAERDQRSGRTTASSESELANVCLEDDPVTQECGVGASAMKSEGSSDSGGSQASADRDSYVLALELGGEEQGRAGDPEAISVPPDCPTGESLLCLFVNQGETYVGDQVAGHAQEALHLDVLPGNLDLRIHLARTQSLVHNDGGEVAGDGVNRPAPVAGSPGSGPAGAGDVQGASGVLPNTGGVWSGLIAMGLLGLGFGTLLLAWNRRRMAELV